MLSALHKQTLEFFSLAICNLKLRLIKEGVLMRKSYILPSEIMLEILSRTPTETVLECKLVSKLWRNLLQHPSFSQMHLNHLNKLDSSKLSFIFYTQVHENPFFYAEYDENLNRFTRTIRIKLGLPFQSCYILNSCNGLICLFDNKDLHLQPLYICNPIIREYIVLLKCEGKSFLIGFGYIPSTNEYKVVKICENSGDQNYGTVQVYTLGSGIGWRNGRKMDYDVISFRQLGVFANGAIHWIDFKGTIVSFDLINEEFRELPSPPCHPRFIVLHVLGGHLCACYNHVRGSDIWALKKNKSNCDVIWSKEFSDVVTPINFTKTGGILCYDYGDKNVYRYASEGSSSRMLVNFGKNFNYGVPHQNTLVSLKTLGEEDMKLIDPGERPR